MTEIPLTDCNFECSCLVSDRGAHTYAKVPPPATIPRVNLYLHLSIFRVNLYSKKRKQNHDNANEKILKTKRKQRKIFTNDSSLLLS